MPSPSNIKLQVSVNGGALQTGPIADGVTVVAGDTISLSAFGASGARTYLYEIYDYPEGMTVPAGWAENEDTGVFYSQVAEPDDWDVPDIWGDYMLRLTIDDGSRNGVEAPDLIDESIALRILSPHGFRDTAFRTSNQFSAKKQWLDAIKKNWRVFESTVAGLIVNTFDTGDTQVNVPDDTITTLNSLDFDALPNQAAPFGAAGSDAFGWVEYEISEAGADDSGAGSECNCHVRRNVRRRGGGNVEFIGLPIQISSHNFTHLLTFTDGDPALMRITKSSDYDSTLKVRTSGFLQTRTLADP